VLPTALEAAFAQRERDVPIRLADRVDVRLFVSAVGDEVWVAIATRGSDGDSVDEPVGDAPFRIAFDAAAAEISEPRFDWPTGPLEWFEVARLGLREPLTDTVVSVLLVGASASRAGAGAISRDDVAARFRSRADADSAAGAMPFELSAVRVESSPSACAVGLPGSAW